MLHLDLSAVKTTDFEPISPIETGDAKIGIIKDPELKALYVLWRQAHTDHATIHGRMNELIGKTDILVSERETQVKQLNDEHERLLAREQAFKDLFWSRLRLEFNPRFNTIGIRKDWKVVGIKHSGQDKDILSDVLPLSEQLNALTLDGIDPNADTPLKEGENPIGIIESEWQKKLYLLMCQTIDKLQELEREYHRVMAQDMDQTAQRQAVEEIEQNRTALKYQITRLKDVFWNEIRLSHDDALKGNIGIRQNWQIVTLPDSNDDDSFEIPEAIANLIAERMLADIFPSGPFSRRRSGGIQIIEIG